MSKRLRVGNLSFDTTNADLKALFSPLGACESVSVITDRARRFAFVEMGSPSEAAAAIAQLNGTELQGRALTVDEVREQTNDGSGSGGHYGSRGH